MSTMYCQRKRDRPAGRPYRQADKHLILVQSQISIWYLGHTNNAYVCLCCFAQQCVAVFLLLTVGCKLCIVYSCSHALLLVLPEKI